MKWKTFFAAITVLVMVGSANAAPVVYEGFAYSAGTIDGSQNGGTGLSATGWSGTTTNVPYSVNSGGLSFTGVTTIGGKLKRNTAPGNAQISRGLAAGAQTALTQDNTTIYFSLLMQNNRYSTGNANDTFLIGTGAFTNADSKPVQLAGGEGFGVFFKGFGASPSGSIDIAGIAFDGGASQISTGLIDTDITGNTNDGGEVYFIVGQIDWAPNGNNDTLSLYNVTDVNAALPAAFATLTADLDQSAFDTLAFGGAQIGAFDEIRFGTTLTDVGVVPEPTSLTLLGLGGLMMLRRRRA